MATINADVLKARGISIPEGSVLERTTREGIKFDVSRLTDEQLNTLANTQALNGGTTQETQQEVPEVIETPAIETERNLLQRIVGAFDVRGQRATREGELIQEANIANIEAERNRINQQLLQEQRSLEKARRTLLEENPDALIGVGAETDFGRIERRSLQKQADLAIIKAGLQGDLETAQNLIEQSLELEFGSQMAELEAIKEQLPFVQQLARSEREEINAAIEAQEAALQEQKDVRRDILDLSRTAAKNGYAGVAQQIAAAETFEEANALFISAGAAQKASADGGVLAPPTPITADELQEQMQISFFDPERAVANANQTLENRAREQLFGSGQAKFTNSELKKLSTGGLLSSPLEEQLNFLYSDSGDTIKNPFE